MTPENVRKDIENISTRIDRFTEVVNTRMEVAEVKEKILIDSFVESAYNRLDLLAIPLIRYISALTARANYTIIRVTFHASPEIITIFLVMVWIYRIVSVAIMIFNILKIIGTVWQVNQIIMSVWPQYKRWFNGLLVKVSELSGHIGWGVDGIGHLMNACAGGINVVGGLMGKNWYVMQAEIMERANELTETFARGFQSIESDPGMWLNALFTGRTLLSADAAGEWWSPISKTIALAVDRAENASEGILGVISELSAIQDNMPETVRKNIPSIIWQKLGQSETYIQNTILPAISTINRNLLFIDAILKVSFQRTSELAGRLANPGEILLGVDDLPEYAKQAQLGMIDDVTSREFEYWTDQERGEMSASLQNFDRINRLMHAPTPEPAFLSMEIPRGSTVGEITAEPHETWFPGGYNDPR